MARNRTTKKKRMLIIWKWRDLTSLSDLLLEHRKDGKDTFTSYQSDIGTGEGKFFKTYPVEKSDLCPDAAVVAISIYKDGEHTQQLLDALIGRYAEEGTEMMVFLHRANFYDEKDVDRLLNVFKDHISKCFLFADGRDYIYYKTQKSGILDDIGSFYSGRDPISGEKINVLDEGIIQQPYFDRVWQYYNIEFETKLFQLKEELMDEWLPFLLPDQPEEIPVAALEKALQDSGERVLLYRLKSLLGMYQQQKDVNEEEDGEHWEENRLREIEEKAIVKLEKNDRQSYIFDDCIRNLEHQKVQERTFVAGAYQEVKEAFKNNFFDAGKTVLYKKEIRDIAEKMDYLIKIIPGELD